MTHIERVATGPCISRRRFIAIGRIWFVALVIPFCLASVSYGQATYQVVKGSPTLRRSPPVCDWPPGTGPSQSPDRNSAGSDVTTYGGWLGGGGSLIGCGGGSVGGVSGASSSLSSGVRSGVFRGVSLGIATPSQESKVKS